MVAIFHLIQSWPGCSNNFVARATRQLYMRGFLNGRPLDGENKHSLWLKILWNKCMYLTAFVISIPHALNSRILKHVELIFIGLSKRPLTSRISKLRCFFVSFPLFCFLYQMTQTSFCFAFAHPCNSQACQDLFFIHYRKMALLESNM